MLKPTAGDTIKHARWAKGLSIQALAEKAAAGVNTIQKLEDGEEVRGQSIYRIARALDLNPLDLFTEEVETA